MTEPNTNGAGDADGLGDPTDAGPGAPVLVCPSCDGLTFTLAPCRCTYGGDRLLFTADADDEAAGRGGGPYRNCLLCAGVGTTTRACHDCGQTGRLRAQLVVTMANLDTGQVASANVVPGVVQPERQAGGGWQLPIGPLVRELASAVGAATWQELGNPGGFRDNPVIPLLAGWRPELPVADRHRLEAAAIATEAVTPWRVYLGRTEPEPPRDPGRELGRLCRLADQLCLDLVVEARRGPGRTGLVWSIRYELPGSPVPAEPHHRYDDLAEAIAATSVTEAMYGLAERGRHAPARYLRAWPEPDPEAEPLVVDVDQLDRQIVGDCVDCWASTANAGAQAIWRDGRWWHTSLRVAGSAETLIERETGQIGSRRRPVLCRAYEPPEPQWWGGPIPHRPCPDCDPDSRLRACRCRLGRDQPEPGCPCCAGAGLAPSPLPCPTCRDSHRIYQGMSVTITKLTGRPVHLNWWAGDPAPAPLVATQPGGKPVHQLPAQFRLADWAGVFGVRPEDLTLLDGGDPLSQDLRDGIVTCDHAGQDPLARYVAWASRGQPGARLLLAAVAPEVPGLADLVRLVLGLHLAVTVTLTDHRRNHGDPLRVHGESWDITITGPGQPAAPADPPTRSTPEAAIRHCLDYLELALAGTVPTDPDQPVPVPQTPTPVRVADPVPLLRRLARHHAGRPVAVHFARTGCELHLLAGRGHARLLATAPTLAAALAALNLRAE